MNMTETNQLEAAVVESLKSGMSKDGQFALIKALRPNGSPSGEDDINLAIPVPMLPKVLGLILKLIETADAGLSSPRPGTSRRRCFAASNVEASESEDGREALTFELALGGKISIAVNDVQARAIYNALAERLGDHGTSPGPQKLH
jgi:hypothetical protein